jgi:hypothetical protein
LLINLRKIDVVDKFKINAKAKPVKRQGRKVEPADSLIRVEQTSLYDVLTIANIQEDACENRYRPEKFVASIYDANEFSGLVRRREKQGDRDGRYLRRVLRPALQ